MRLFVFFIIFLSVVAFGFAAMKVKEEAKKETQGTITAPQSEVAVPRVDVPPRVDPITVKEATSGSPSEPQKDSDKGRDREAPKREASGGSSAASVQASEGAQVSEIATKAPVCTDVNVLEHRRERVTASAKSNEDTVAEALRVAWEDAKSEKGLMCRYDRLSSGDSSYAIRESAFSYNCDPYTGSRDMGYEVKCFISAMCDFDTWITKKECR